MFTLSTSASPLLLPLHLLLHFLLLPRPHREQQRQVVLLLYRRPYYCYPHYRARYPAPMSALVFSSVRLERPQRSSRRRQLISRSCVFRSAEPETQLSYRPLKEEISMPTYMRGRSPIQVPLHKVI